MVRYILSFLVLICLFQCTTSRAIPKDFQCELIDEPLIKFKVDIFGNIYTIDPKNQLKVYDKEFNLLFEYYNNILGDISYIDVTNPKKIILFFSGFQKMVFLDDALSELGRYEGELNIIAMGSSRDNNLWVYDGVDYRLKKITRQDQVVLESNPVESFHRLDILPDYILEYNNMVYLVEEGKGIAVFDNFGTYSTYLPIEAFSVSFGNQSMFYVKNGNLYQKILSNPFAEERKIKTVSTSGVETAYLFDKTIYFLEDFCLKSTTLD